MAVIDAQPLPLAQDRAAWAYVERDSLGVHGACDLVLRVPAGEGASPELPPALSGALPLLLHEFDRQPGLNELLARLGAAGGAEAARGPSPKATLRRLLPRLITYRYVDTREQREFVFDGFRPSSIHVLGRVLETDHRFRLEDLSHFATHGELLGAVLQRIGLPRGLDPDAVLYCPAIDAPFPFKFAVVGDGARSNRDAYVEILRQLLRKTESDEVFRSRNFRELTRGFQKFGPAAATPQFQEVELRIWRLLSYLAARLRVKAGRLTDAAEAREVDVFLRELRHVHQALDDLVQLPSRLAAFYRGRFDLEFSGLYERALPELEEIARRIDCDLEDRERSIEALAGLVSEFRRLGSASPLESLEAKDREIKAAYGDVEVPPLETGWARTYTETIFTGATRFDTRRFDPAAVLGAEGAEEAQGSELSEDELDLGIDLEFGFGGGGGDDPDDDETREGDPDGEEGAGLDVDLSFLDDPSD